MYLSNCNELRELLSKQPTLLTPTTYGVAMMIAVKNGAVTAATIATTTSQKAQEPGNNAIRLRPDVLYKGKSCFNIF